MCSYNETKRWYLCYLEAIRSKTLYFFFIVQREKGGGNLGTTYHAVFPAGQGGEGEGAIVLGRGAAEVNQGVVPGLSPLNRGRATAAYILEGGRDGVRQIVAGSQIPTPTLSYIFRDLQPRHLRVKNSDLRL